MTRAEFLETSTQMWFKERPVVLPYLHTPLLYDVQMLTADSISASQRTFDMTAELDMARKTLDVPEQITGSVISYRA